MARNDYYPCDLCDRKAFYDANLNYQQDDATGEVTLDNVGDMKVICVDCAKNNRIIIVEKD